MSEHLGACCRKVRERGLFGELTVTGPRPGAAAERNCSTSGRGACASSRRAMSAGGSATQHDLSAVRRTGS